MDTGDNVRMDREMTENKQEWVLKICGLVLRHRWHILGRSGKNILAGYNV